MKKFLLTLICLFAAANVFAQKTNFSGTWQIDTTRVYFGMAPHNIIPITIKVDQQHDKLILTRILLDGMLKPLPPVTETLSFDGTPSERTVGGITISTSINWVNDQSFTLERKSSPVNATETWTLENDGKTLIIDRSVEQTANNFSYKNKGVYTKQ